MADSIQISTQVLMDTASKVRNINATLDEKLAECNNQMQNLKNTWNSAAAEDIRAAMLAMKPRFEQYKSVIDSYATFLDKTAQSYEATESSIQTNAGAFR